METFLMKYQLERYIVLFQEHKLEIELLNDLSDAELEDTLKKIALPLRTQLKIRDGIKRLKTRGMYYIRILKKHYFNKLGKSSLQSNE